MRKVPDWNTYFMNIAEVVATRSKDSNRNVGALLTENNIIVGTGFNGFRSGVLETEELWQRPFKYEHVIHAEINCLNHTPNITDKDNLNLYTTTFPCINCMKEIIKYPSIKNIYYKDLYTDSQESKTLAMENGINLFRVE